jgi:hypothetical protein
MFSGRLRRHLHQDTKTVANARRDGALILLLGCAVIVLLGPLLESASPWAMIDFKLPYYSTRCLLKGCNPYNGADVLRVYHMEGENQLLEKVHGSPDATRLVYLPTIFVLTSPLALLTFGPAHLVWMVLEVSGLIMGSFLMWDLGVEYAPILSGCLTGFMLANCELLTIVGNPAGIAISSCVAGVWFLVKRKHEWAGVFCLTAGLMVKPHDVGFVWLYFLLAGKAYRKRALQALFMTLGLSAAMVLWVSHVGPSWVSDLRSTLRSISALGAMNDPGPASSGAHGLGMMVNLQTVISYVRDDPRFYNFITYTICGILLLVWMRVTLRSHPSPARTWLALASISAFTMLPVYHRQVDTKLLLLTVPACALLCAEGGRTGRFAALFTCAAFVLTGDIPWAIALRIIHYIHLPATPYLGKILVAVQILPIPLILLAVCLFYLWVYAHRAPEEVLT